MAKSLPARPDLDQLRRQAKELLALLKSGDAAAAQAFAAHLPAAKGKSAAAVREGASTGAYRLADAQSVIARSSGFQAWPKLARHVEQLRALEGTWRFVSLELDGGKMALALTANSRIMIDGDRFRTESPEAVYEGEFNINVEAEPHEIDIEFVDGPEAGNWNYGIFRLSGDELEMCLNITGGPRPKTFKTAPGTGHACEVLRRESEARPAGVSGGRRGDGKTGTPKEEATGQAEIGGAPAGFEFVETPLLKKLAGEWEATRLMVDGKETPTFMVKTGKRTCLRNEVKVEFGGGVVIHALVKYDDSVSPITVDYFGLDGAGKGMTQHGILEWRGEEVCVCMAPPGQARPTGFEGSAGNGWVVSQWKRK